MKIFLYLLGFLLILYLVSFYYEREREKSFLKKDLQEAGDQIVYNKKSEMQTAQRNGTSFFNVGSRTIQNDIKYSYDDVRGAVKLRQ